MAALSGSFGWIRIAVPLGTGFGDSRRPYVTNLRDQLGRGGCFEFPGR